MNPKNQFKPGQLIMTDYGAYSHLSVVSDARCTQGKLMLISATARTKTVREEPYDKVVRGLPTRLAPSQSCLPISAVLKMARSQIDKWDYNFVSRNCEHFAYWAAGLNMSSQQVKSTLSGALLFGGMTAVLMKKQSIPLILGLTLIGGWCGLAASQNKYQ